MTNKTDFYSYRVIWSEENQNFIGMCSEFPSLSWLAKSPESALRGIRKVVSDVIADMKANGENPPAPLSFKKYSGKFMVRVPPNIHRKLALLATEEGVSLNRLISARLSQYCDK